MAEKQARSSLEEHVVYSDKYNICVLPYDQWDQQSKTFRSNEWKRESWRKKGGWYEEFGMLVCELKELIKVTERSCCEYHGDKSGAYKDDESVI